VHGPLAAGLVLSRPSPPSLLARPTEASQGRLRSSPTLVAPCSWQGFLAQADDHSEAPLEEIAVLLARVSVLMGRTPVENARDVGLPALMERAYEPDFFSEMARAGLFGPPTAGPCESLAVTRASTGPSDAVVAVSCGSTAVKREPLARAGLFGPPTAGPCESLAVTAACGSTGPSDAVVAASCGSAEVERQPRAAPEADNPKVGPSIASLRRPAAKCACCGACGAKRCAVAKNAFYRRGADTICPAVATGNARYCTNCVCEVDGCNSPRHRLRWCKKHGAEYSVGDCQRTYSNLFQARATLQAQWPAELKSVARLAFAFPRMTPDDLTVLTGSQTLTPVYVVKTFIAHAIKWPWAVQHFLDRTQQVSDRSVTADELQIAAEALTCAFLATVAEASGCPNKDMFDRLNSGRMHASTGLAVQGQELGVIAKQRGARLGRNLGTEASLGPAQTKYYFAESDSQASWLAACIAGSQHFGIRHWAPQPPFVFGPIGLAFQNGPANKQGGAFRASFSVQNEARFARLALRCQCAVPVWSSSPPPARPSQKKTTGRRPARRSFG